MRYENWGGALSCGAGGRWGGGPYDSGGIPVGDGDDFTFTGRIQGGTDRYRCDLWVEDVLARGAALVGGWEVPRLAWDALPATTARSRAQSGRPGTRWDALLVLRPGRFWRGYSESAL